MSGFSHGEIIALEVCPKITSVFSIVGSAAIVTEILKLKIRRQVTHHILLFMSIYDVLNSFAFFLSTWPIPEPAGKGNTATCDAQGFVIQVGLCIPLWNALLATAFLAKIRWGWDEKRLRKCLPVFHILAWVFPFATAITCLLLKSFNNANLWCWIAPVKDGLPNPDNRGEYARIFQIAFFYAPLWCIMAYVCVSMFLIYKHVHDHEHEMKKAGIRKPGQPRPSKRVRNQALWYSAALILTWIFGSINRVTQLAGANVFGLLLLHSIFVPAQGFFNFLVYKYSQHGYIRKRLKVICCFFCCRFAPKSPNSASPKTSEKMKIFHSNGGSYVPTEFPLAKMMKKQLQSEESSSQVTNDNNQENNSEYVPTTFRPDGLEIGRGIMDNKDFIPSENVIGSGKASDNKDSEYIPTTFIPEGVEIGRNIMEGGQNGHIVAHEGDVLMRNDVPSSRKDCNEGEVEVVSNERDSLASDETLEENDVSVIDTDTMGRNVQVI